MPLPCNNVRVTPIKVSQLLRYSNLDGGDFLLTVESGSSLLSRRSTINDLKNSFGRLTGSYSGSFTGSFKGKASGSFSGSFYGSVLSKNTKASGSFSGSFYGSVLSKNTKASGSFSGSHYGSLVSKNTKASGSFSGSFYGSVLSKNTKASGSFSGSFYGSVLSKNTKASGSFSGSHYGSLVSKNTKASGSFSGSFYGSVLSKNTKASGSFSGSFYGSLLSKNAKASGSFSGSHYGSLISKNTKASGSFSGSHYGKIIGSNGSLITGSFRGIDNITNFKGTGKKVSFNGTASYAVSSSFALTASYLNPLGSGGNPTAFAYASWTGTSGGITPLSEYNINSITRTGTQPVNSSQSPGRYCDIVFTTPCIDANYTVLSYCSSNSPADVATNGRFYADLGTSVVSDRTAAGFRVTVFTGWWAGQAGDGDDYWYNTSQFPDYNSFVVFR